MSKASQRDTSGALSAPTAASLLGLKGHVIIRAHGSQQKPHVILRPLELDDESATDGDAPKDPNMLYFSLFAAKRIECKPGKEILVALEDSVFGDRPIIFGGEMLDAEADSDDDAAVEEAVKESTPPLEAVMPPKMRKKWGRGDDIPSSPTAPSSTVSNVPQKTYCEMGTQTDMVVFVQTSEAIAPAPAQSLTAFNHSLHVDSSVPASSPPGYVRDPDALALHASVPGEKLIEATETETTGKARSVHLAVDDKVRARSGTPMELDSPGAALPENSKIAARKSVDKADIKPDENSVALSSLPASAAAGSAFDQEQASLEIAQLELAPVDVPMAELERAAVPQKSSSQAPAEEEEEEVPGFSEAERTAVETVESSSAPPGSTISNSDASPSPQVRAPEAVQSADTHEPKLEYPAPEASNADIASTSAQDVTDSAALKSEAPTPSPSFTMPSPSALRAFLPDAVSRLLPLIGTPGAENQSPMNSNASPDQYLPVPSPPPSEPTPPPKFAPESPAPSNGSAPAASFSHYQGSTSRPQSARSPAPSNASNSTSQFIARTSRSRSPVMASRPPTMSDANATPVGGDSGWASRRNSQQFPPSRRHSGSFNSPTRSGSFDGGPPSLAPNPRFRQGPPPPPGRPPFNNNFGGASGPPMPPRGRSPSFDRYGGPAPNGPPSYRDGPPPPMNQGFGGPNGPPGRSYSVPGPNGGWDEPPPPRNGPPFPPGGGVGRNGPPNGPPFPPNGLGRGGPVPYNDGPVGPGPYSPHDMGPPFPPQGDMGGRNGPFPPGPPGRRNGPPGGPPFPPNDMGPRNGPPFPLKDMPPPRNNSFPPPGGRNGPGSFNGPPPPNGPPRNGRFNGPPPNDGPPFPPNGPGPGFNNGPPPFSPHDGPPGRFGGPGSNNSLPPSPVDAGRFGSGGYGPPRGTGPPPHDGGRFPSGGGPYPPEGARYPPDPYGGPPPPGNNNFGGPPPSGPLGPFGGPPPNEPYNDGYGGPPKPTSTALSAMLAQLAEATAATRHQEGGPPFPPGPPGPPGFQGPPGPPGPPPMMGGGPPPPMPPPNARRQGPGPGHNNKRFNNSHRDRPEPPRRPPSPNYGSGNARFESPTGSLKRKASAMSEPELPPPPPENMSVAPAAAAPVLPITPARAAPSGYTWPTTAPLRATALPGGIKSLSLSGDGGLIALLGGGADADTVSIWDNATCAEVARLAHASPVVEVAWGSEDAASVGDALAALCEGGAVFRWTRPLTGGPWRCERVSDAPAGAQDQPTALAHAHGRVAAAFAKYGVRIWIRDDRGWTAQRSVLRQNVSSVKFVEDGSALLGGTKDGVMWYCQVQGLMRACAFFKSEVRDIDISANGRHALVSQADGCAALVRIEDDNRGQVERLFTIKDNALSATFGPSARLAPGLVLWGAAQGFVLIWDFQQAQIIRAMDTGEGSEPVAIALCRTPRSGIASALIVGTADGRLTWWAPPEDAQGEPNAKRVKVE